MDPPSGRAALGESPSLKKALGVDLAFNNRLAMVARPPLSLRQPKCLPT